MPIQRVEHWDEKARKADEMAEAMRTGDAKRAMLEIGEPYRQLAKPTAKLVVTESRKM